MKGLNEYKARATALVFQRYGRLKFRSKAYEEARAQALVALAECIKVLECMIGSDHMSARDFTITPDYVYLGKDDDEYVFHMLFTLKIRGQLIPIDDIIVNERDMDVVCGSTILNFAYYIRCLDWELEGISEKFRQLTTEL